jgi:hypothetical protein
MQPINCPFYGQSKSQDHLLLLLSIVHTRPTSGFLPAWAPAVRTHGHFGMCKQSIPRKKKKREHSTPWPCGFMYRSIHHESCLQLTWMTNQCG